MAELPPNVKGMNDILPPEVSKWHFVEEKARSVLDAFAYREVRTPVLEYTPLFVRGVGETTDIVEKEMYTFPDRDGSSVTMRPEGTASAVRAYIADARWNKEPVTRWFYMGPMFRHERPQRGRLRQFHQIGAEIFGLGGPSIDAELIGMLVALLAELGIPAASLDVALNTLGTAEERQAYRDVVRAYFEGHRQALDEDSMRRLETNPLRILDSKNPDVQAVAAAAPVLIDTLGSESRTHFETVRSMLDTIGVKSTVDPRLVRGLDYYSRTVFELKANVGNLGAQNTVAAGGRYDRLVESLGGPQVPALGFGMGIERVLLAIAGDADSYEPTVTLFVASIGDKARAWALPVAHRLRLAGVRVEMEHRDTGLKSQLKRADKLKARLALIVGETELASGKLVLRDLASGTQHELAEGDLESKVRQLTD